MGKVPSNRVGVIKDDNNRFENDYAPKYLANPMTALNMKPFIDAVGVVM
ncbi:MAG: hypothetical protein IPQ23_21245 [Cytophagaceae bacterium]|nr:hypothetical protein [Cytophagaceae bacterium]